MKGFLRFNAVICYLISAFMLIDSMLGTWGKLSFVGAGVFGTCGTLSIIGVGLTTRIDRLTIQPPPPSASPPSPSVM